MKSAKNRVPPAVDNIYGSLIAPLNGLAVHDMITAGNVSSSDIEGRTKRPWPGGNMPTFVDTERGGKGPSLNVGIGRLLRSLQRPQPIRSGTYSLLTLAVLTAFHPLIAAADEGLAYEELPMAIVGRPNYWTTRTLNVCFEAPEDSVDTDEERSEMARVKRRLPSLLEETWGRSSAMSFVGFRDCGRDTKEIRVRYVGTSGGQTRPFGEEVEGAQVIRLGVTAPEGTIVHEFGHGLGFIHPMDRSDTPAWCIPRTTAAGEARAAAAEKPTPWDAQSIMNYCRDNSFGNRTALSPWDIVGAQSVYGASAEQALGANEVSDNYGSAIAVGDFDGDGWMDAAVGAPGEDYRGDADAGAVFVYDGNGRGALQHTQLLTEERADGGTNADHRFGSRLHAVDLDGDGDAELVVSSPGGGRNETGMLHVFDHVGDEMKLLGRIASPDERRIGRQFVVSTDWFGLGRAQILVDASERDSPSAVKGLIFNPSNSSFRWARDYVPQSGGSALAIASDDLQPGGGDELAIYVGPRSGQPSYVELVRTNAQTNNPEVYEKLFRGGQASSIGFRGISLTTGDFTGNGRIDIVVASHFGTAARRVRQAGTVSLFESVTSGFRHVAEYDQGMLTGGAPEARDFFAFRVAAGDFNGDGISDLAITTPNETRGWTEEKPGFVQIVYGPIDERSPHHQWIGQKPISRNVDGERFGRYLLPADLDKDGVSELLIGATGDTTREGTDAGRVYVFRMPPRKMEAWYSIDQRHIDY